MCWNECAKCGEWLSLGPSNDSPPEVQLEMRAAEIAAGLEVGGDGFFAKWRVRFMEEVEDWGWQMYEVGWGCHDEGRAGYLAACIAEEEE